VRLATIPRIEHPASEFWGGLAAMLVALPSAIAFGVTIYLPLGPEHAASGAIAGILGTIALGLVAPVFGGTSRLITAPCAPAAAVLAAVTIELARQGVAPGKALLMMALIALLAGLLQVVFGVVRLGRLIKYMPYPVVSGYLSGVGLIIILSQLPRFLGAPKGVSLWNALSTPSAWQWQGIVVGAVTVAVVVGAPRMTKAVPAAILGLAAGVAAYFGLAAADARLLTSAGNPLVIGPLGGAGGDFLDAAAGRWHALAGVSVEDVRQVIVPAATLAVLLSIDTLKTCVVLDALTRSRHDSNRELVGQGLGNLATTAIGGIPGAGQMGATLVNISSGGRTRLSGFLEGVLAIGAFAALGGLIAWVPIAALAGILIVIGVRMLDTNTLHLLRRRSTILDFFVILSVVVVAVSWSLIAASAVGIALAIVLFIREQIGGAVVRRKAYGNQMFSKRMRLQEEMAVLEKRGEETAILELQGSLFFGTTDQLYTAVEPELKARRYVILDMRRVQSVDFTAAHMLERFEDMMAERKGLMIFSAVPYSAPSGQDMVEYLEAVGLVKSEGRARVFGELDEALEWTEERLIEEEHVARAQEAPLELREIDMFKRRKEETLAELEACMEKRTYAVGEKIFTRGDGGTELFLIRRGAVRIQLPLAHGQAHHLATFGRGDFFGEMSFLDHAERSADAIAFTDTDLYILSRERFDAFAEGHRKLAVNLFEALARALSLRLRYTNAELRLLQEA
jgi:SulP family sulfate permease